ncbi:hypothetical protein [Pelosinus propionicus]|uniref:Uncharacterized protein n=1 Tax=Pelosinus propionicus DSM 13327 TaxID=1123291 RepID=A0A1I4KQK2_9FIRM|nr:hypothetical protein [Pelosinus propionicus]SFL80893.1 hypothetical protein SAMN04490355_101916 [Pelosinus propionicus DSM 13327]
MLIVDFIGIVATTVLIGIRYPHHVLLAISLHELGEIVMAVVFNGQIDTIIAAGAFSTMAVSNYNSSLIGTLLLFSGSLANFIASSLAGGIAFEPTSRLLNPLSALKHPFAVVNFRLCVLAGLISLWKIFV